MYTLTRRRWATVLTTTAALALGAGALGACGADPAATEEHQHGDGADDGDGVFDIRTTEYAFTTERASVAAGSVTVRLTNDGAEPHQVHIARAPEGVDAQTLIQTFEDEGEAATFEAVDWVGGVSGVEPGEAASAVVDLEPGEYVLVCYLPGPDGTSHVVQGMVSPLHVTAPEPTGPAVTTPEVSPTETVVLSDFHVELPEGFRGQGVVAFRNEGDQNHEVVFVRLREGKTVADAVAWQASHEGPAPFSFANGIATIAPGMTATSTLDLAPGDYIAACFVQGPDGSPHIDLGMVTLFTVT